MIEAYFTPIAGIEGAVGIEPCPGNAQSQPFEGFEGRLKMGLQTKGVMVVASQQTRRGDHKTLGVGDGQDVAGLGVLARLVGHTFTALFGKAMAAIEVQPRQIQGWSDRLDAGLPHPLQAAVGAPFLEVVVHRLPTDLFFSGSLAASATGSCFH